MSLMALISSELPNLSVILSPYVQVGHFYAQARIKTQTRIKTR